MASYLKKAFSLFITFFLLISCSSDDSTTERPIGNLINEDGTSINVEVLKRINPDFVIENLQTTGGSNVDLLTDAKFTSLTLEIISIEGSEPEASSVTSLVNFINERIHKPDGVTVVQRSIASTGLETLSSAQVFEAVEAPFRTQFNSGTNISVFIFFADVDSDSTSFEGDMGSATLGTAYFNTSIVIYKSTLDKLVSSNLDRLADVEASTLRHEFTHLLGLVNIGTNMVTPHEDFQTDENGEIVNDEDGNPIGNGHCNVPRCLMEANARFISDMMGGVEILRLDPLCIQDLQRIGGK